MAKRTLSPIEQMTVDVRNELLTVIIPCSAKNEPFHFSPRGERVGAVAKAIGVTDPTLRAFAAGKSVSTGTVAKVQRYFEQRNAEQAEPTEA